MTQKHQSILVIIPCSKKKNFSPTQTRLPAEKAYAGQLFLKAQKYAKVMKYKWLILSAKYGYLYPSDLIKDYDTFFSAITKNLKKDSQTISVNALLQQTVKIVEKRKKDIETNNTTIIAFGGRVYIERVYMTFGKYYHVASPLSGLKGSGFMLQALNKYIRERTTF